MAGPSDLESIMKFLTDPFPHITVNEADDPVWLNAVAQANALSGIVAPGAVVQGGILHAGPITTTGNVTYAFTGVKAFPGNEDVNALVTLSGQPDIVSACRWAVAEIEQLRADLAQRNLPRGGFF